MYDDELHSNCGNVVYLAWNFFTNKILNRESLTSPTKSQQNEKQNIKENLTHTQLQTHQEHKNMKGWISRKNYILLAHSFHTHACIHITHTHTHKRERERCHSLIIPFLLVRLISSLVRSKGLCNSVFFLFPFLSFAFLCSSWSSFFCRNALWWLLRVIRNSPTVSRAH